MQDLRLVYSSRKGSELNRSLAVEVLQINWVVSLQAVKVRVVPVFLGIGLFMLLTEIHHPIRFIGDSATIVIAITASATLGVERILPAIG